MKTALITVIKKTIFDLVNNRKKYEWTSVESCNCGVLASNVDGFKFNIMDFSGGWSGTIRTCSITGEPLKKVFQDLIDIGLSRQDICELEHLSNEEICKEAGLRRIYNDTATEPYWFASGNSNKPTLIKYLQAWVRILEREPQQVAPPKEIYKLKNYQSEVSFKSLTTLHENFSTN